MNRKWNDTGKGWVDNDDKLSKYWRDEFGQTCMPETRKRIPKWVKPMKLISKILDLASMVVIMQWLINIYNNHSASFLNIAGLVLLFCL